jgi:ABC-type transport system involved in multi-copper enzyme maturation permease subunit
VKEGGSVVPYLMTAVLLNGIKNTMQGVLVGLRKQIFASMVSFFSYYVIMLGLSILFTVYFKMGVKGVWIAEAIGYLFIVVSYFVFLMRVDFSKVVEITKQKLAEDQKAIKEISERDEKESVYCKSFLENNLSPDEENPDFKLIREQNE